MAPNAVGINSYHLHRVAPLIGGSECRRLSSVISFSFLLSFSSRASTHASTESLLKGGRLSTVHLHVLTSLDQLIYMLKYYLPSLQNKLFLFRRSNVLSRPVQLVFPGARHSSSHPHPLRVWRPLLSKFRLS
jgi:hypothetical protein